MEPINFQNDGYKLAGHLFRPDSPKPLAFLMVQGWLGHENLPAAQALCESGYRVLTYDMRGNGKSEGNIGDFSRSDFVRDSAAAYDFLQKQIAPDTAIGVIGSSFGGYTAALLSRRRPVRCLSLRVPANYPDEGFSLPQEARRHITRDYLEWRKRPLRYDQNSALQALHDFSGPIQIIEAEMDEMVSHQTVMNYKEAAANGNLSYSVMKGAPHRLATEALKGEYVRLLTSWVTPLRKLR